jgi:hypothetical protein
MCGSTGKGNTLFHTLVNHFSSQATTEFLLAGSIRGLLTLGQATLFNHVNALNPDSFVPSRFSSCGSFMDHTLNPTENSTESLVVLFRVEEVQKYSCAIHPELHQGSSQTNQPFVFMINIFKQTFECNNITPKNVA